MDLLLFWKIACDVTSRCYLTSVRGFWRVLDHILGCFLCGAESTGEEERVLSEV